MNLRGTMEKCKLVLSEKNVAYVLLGLGLILVIGFAGIGKKEKSVPAMAEQTSNASDNDEYITKTQLRLEEVISQIKGVGSVSVMITLESGVQSVLAVDEKISENVDGDKKAMVKDTQVITADKAPIVLQQKEPKMAGVVVVAEGGENKKTALQISEAVAALTGVGTHKIVVCGKK